MLVRLIEEYRREGSVLASGFPGDLLDLSRGDAIRLIEAGAAVPVPRRDLARETR